MGIVTICELRSDIGVSESRNDIIRRLRAIGAACDIDDAEICRRIDVKPSRWANFVSPKDKREITRRVAYKVCDEFNVTLDWIYRGKALSIPQEILDADRKLRKVGKAA
jgi:transcriptional regulator with XRE-family HTH domain